MELYSQKATAYGNMKLGKSKLTVNSHGCFLVSLATLYQQHPVTLLNVPNAFDPNGLLKSEVIAEYCGGQKLPQTTRPPKGWSVAMTDHWKSAGYDTHFFLYNSDTNEQIDPLDLPASVEPLSYNIVYYRPFTNTKLNTASWQDEAKRWAIQNNIITTGWDNPSAPISQVRLAAALKNFQERFLSK